MRGPNGRAELGTRAAQGTRAREALMSLARAEGWGLVVVLLVSSATACGGRPTWVGAQETSEGGEESMDPIDAGTADVVGEASAPQTFAVGSPIASSFFG